MSFNNKRKIVDLHQSKKSKSLLIDDKISAHTLQNKEHVYPLKEITAE